MRRISVSIKTAILGGLLLGTSIPLALATLYAAETAQTKLYAEFAKHRQEIARNLARSMADPIYFIAPNNGSLVLEVVKQDPAINRIEVYDGMNEMAFIEIEIPQRRTGNTFVNRETVVRDGREIGWIEMRFNDVQLIDEMGKKRRDLVAVFGVTFVALLLVIFPLLYFKVLQPLKKLHAQSRQLSANRLDDAFVWLGGDEISQLGQSFEKARIAILNFVGELKEKNGELERLSRTDRLTGLFNRHMLDEVLLAEQARSRRFDRTFGVILVDVDHFKSVNDTHGHLTGDLVLQEMASLLRDTGRATDTVGRWGGEEFLVVCPETTLEGTFRLAELLRQRICEHSFPVVRSKTASFGVAAYGDREAVASLIARADEALYRAKESGRNKVCGHQGESGR